VSPPALPSPAVLLSVSHLRRGVRTATPTLMRRPVVDAP
jgi:hypothetical protein